MFSDASDDKLSSSQREAIDSEIKRLLQVIGYYLSYSVFSEKKNNCFSLPCLTCRVGIMKTVLATSHDVFTPTFSIFAMS